MSSSSSAQQNPRHLLNHLYGGGPAPTSAPPPTPSTQPPSLSSTSDSAAADTLSRLLHRLPPNLSLPTLLSPRGAVKSSSSSPPQQKPLPTLSLSSTSFPCSSRSSLELGYFQLTHHSITSQLAESAELDSRSLLELPLVEKLSSFPTDWPLGFNSDDDDDDNESDDHKTGSFCLDAECSSTNSELSLVSLRELTRELEKVGLEVVDKVASAVGFENPFRGEGEGVGPKQYSTLMWLSSSSSDGGKGREVYPYVVGLQYQIRAKKLDLVSDSGSVIVEPKVGSVLVTLGDIAQVWSNGKLKKVRGRPAPVLDDAKSSLPCISMTMLLTLPLESTVSPLLNIFNKSTDHSNREKEALELEDQDKEGDNNDSDLQSIEPSISTNHGNIDDGKEDQRVFNSFSFEDYAWRVYHERLHFKDSLDRYRVID